MLQSFLTARSIVLAALLCSRIVAATGHRTEGLLGWDAAWYQSLARVGYGYTPREGLRFFPLLPLLARGVGTVMRSDAVALLLIANVGALVYAALAARMAEQAGLGRETARWVPWTVALAPTGFVLVMGYSEPLFGILICLVLLASRSRSWLVAAVAGALAGALRPTGIVLGLPLLMEAVAGLRTAPRREWPARALAVVSPAIGMAAYLLWVRDQYGDGLLPFKVQTSQYLRAGVLVDPLPSLWHALTVLVGVNHGSAAPLVHLFWLALAVVLLVRCARTLPASWTAFSAVTVFLAFTARELTSFERYTASAVPLLLVAASWLAEVRPTTRRRVLVGAGVVLFGYALAAFGHAYIP